MKIRTYTQSLLFAALASLLASSLSAAPPQNPAMMYRVGDVIGHKSDSDSVKIGTSRRDVRDALGVPSQTISRDLWLYRRFHANLDEANENGCTTLVVSFARNHVTSLSLVNNNAAAVIIARASVQPRGTIPTVLIATAD